MALACAGLMAVFGRVSGRDWFVPDWLEGDPVEVYARVKLAAEQPWAWLAGPAGIDRLGAPATADWLPYPIPDRPLFVATGGLAAVAGLFGAINGMVALITALNAVSFYLTARWLRCRWEWAAALALVFAFCSYNLRWGITLSLGQTFALPPLVLLCARAARRAPWPGNRRRWLALAGGLGVWLGVSNPYLAFFAGVVAGGTLVLSWLRRSPRARWLPLALFLATLVVTFALGNARYLAQTNGEIQTAVVRGTGDRDRYALRPLEWITPPADHRIPALGRLGQAFQRAEEGRGEFSYNYLGLAGLAGMAGLLIVSAVRLRQRRLSRVDAALGLAWITLFAIAGGVNSWVGALTSDLFRAGSRIGVYAVIWALLFLAGGLSRRTRRWPRAATAGTATLLAILAIWEQTPSLHAAAARENNRQRWAAIHAGAAALESALSPDARIFQLPALPFPEAGPVRGMSDYQHFLPLLASRTLHFSYGHTRSSPWVAWNQYVGRLPAAEMVRTLEDAGFAALWLDGRAYADEGAELARQLTEAGAAAWPFPAPLPGIRIFRLNPAASPHLPDPADPRYRDPWDPAEAENGLLALAGWYPLERNETNRWRWAARQAESGCWRPSEATGTLRFKLGGPATSTIVLRAGDRELWRGRPGPVPVQITLTLNAGLNTLLWTLEGRTFRPGKHDPRELGFMVENLSLSVP